MYKERKVGRSFCQVKKSGRKKAHEDVVEGKGRKTVEESSKRNASQKPSGSTVAGQLVCLRW